MLGHYCSGDPVDHRLCMPGPCADGGWSQWGTWSSCSVSCGGGVRSQSRTCTNPSPSLTGKYCDGKNMQISSCNDNSCGSYATVPNIVFNAYNLTDRSPAVNETMVFNNVVVNDGEGYNATTGEFTAPIDGTYSFSAQLCIHDGESLYFDIKVGNTTYATAYAFDDDAPDCSMIQTSARVKENEKVIVQWTTKSQKGSVLVQNSHLKNFFSGMLVHL
ncbi:A disintegrin and metalloproteinase with thrombospondin motifs 6-like [Mercenaria mercenaria]|uniref:A disintegrin and metalloproteinase with thrombospondin motifs 6-like n=1 Tax=Mercenaria mercenaria TaxID=6596 RepID=UPI00234F681F|nr:A disintegrin and metalloproteinase with thrombospondin motifs 6-like [Mercenaria mercenaria]